MSNWLKEKSEKLLKPKPKRKSLEEIHKEYFTSEEYVISSVRFHSKNFDKITPDNQ